MLAAGPLCAQPEVSGKIVEQAVLRYIDIQAGTGPAAGPGQQYTVHYTGWLRDGKQFDSSVGKKPLQFVQGRREVIPGFEAGFEGMRVGGKRRIFIPYQLAYGEQGRGSIPPKADLTFDVELLAVADVPAQPAAADLLLPLGDIEKKVIALAKAIPSEKYTWRPGAGVRSVREVLLHIALGNHLMLNISDGLSGEELSKQIAATSAGDKQDVSRDRVIEMLAESFAAVRKDLETARPTGLNRSVDFFGTATTKRGVLAALDAHMAEHLGQLIAYARMNGIVPPWSQ
jgi:uncharacterized damage-inducible protein DinB